MGRKKNRGYWLLIGSLFVNLVLAGVLVKPYLSYRHQQKKPNQEKRRETVVNKVIDGDTFNDDKQIYRLYEIDAPEKNTQCLGLEATDRLGSLILGKKVNLIIVGDDHFGRSLVYVFVNDLFVNQTMVEEGLARYKKEVTSKESVKIGESELQAKRTKRGIFSSRCQKPNNCKIKGNYRRDRKTKIYHTPDCYNYKKIVINEKKGDHWFCNEDEAKKAGFIKAKDCP